MQDLLQHTINGLSLGSIYALIALGYTMVYGILQLINFAHADVYMVGAFATYFFMGFFGRVLGYILEPSLLTLLICLIVSMTACALLGFLIERLAYRPLRKAPKLNILITAIGVSLFLQYSAQIVFGADPKVFPNVLNDSVIWDLGVVQLRLFDVTVLFVTIAMTLLLRHLILFTKTGKAMRAVSQNRDVASLMGIQSDQIISRTFMLGSALAGVGSVLVGMKYPKIDPLMGTMIGLKAFVAAVLGGIGSLPGAVFGGILMGLSEEMVVGYLSSTYRDALAFGLLILILIFKPSGLLGRGGIEKV